ncbi:5-oxoprolinase subunit PxpA [Pseudoalteromonas tunicata]|jgi:UPF0271 protein|uniref:LamB/YcsF family protein n=1 Tax=Pseudoalteromonas tunicata D2 TaxID=87626 RepID=A4CAP4_9GAMM|nr:5-oxoprolinase subunit PxpA [Pseudoalteromonas tunicata]ATC94997.1 UPF0271 protein [Pseudoalteromonas tunicata]AXT30653.1 5-oxoprolinase subunit PxpA [Pseudoalteromonas tunicata]EAR28452.1 LamB/YcsF family protein [Pseudoalteromonas tunicata D2]
MKLNCDLGESYGAWQMGLDSQMMAHIDMANIACGFHAGDPLVLTQTLALAKQHNVIIGAHPSYPDLVGFGRRSMQCSQNEIISMVHYQISALDGMAKNIGLTLSYVKPHGALYNDMMAKPEVQDAIFIAISQYHRPLKLMMLAGNDNQTLLQKAQHHNVSLLFEAFADRRYQDNGQLTPRSQLGAVLSQNEILSQVQQLLSKGTVITDTATEIPLSADTLCVHGDNEAAIALIAQIKQLCIKSEFKNQ